MHRQYTQHQSNDICCVLTVHNILYRLFCVSLALDSLFVPSVYESRATAVRSKMRTREGITTEIKITTGF